MIKISKNKNGRNWMTVNGKRYAINITGPNCWIEGVNPALIKIRPRGKSYFASDVTAALGVENNSDMLTDYFEADQIRLLPEHFLYAQAKAAA